MTRDELEFSISQYLDGTLAAAERDALETRLGSDAEARAVYAEYEALQGALVAAPLPAVRWDRLADQISAAVSREEMPAQSYKLSRWLRPARLAVAASVLLAGAIGFSLLRPDPTPTPFAGGDNGTLSVVPPPAPIRIVVKDRPADAPTPEVVRNRGPIVVAVGPPRAADEARPARLLYADTIVTRPSKAVIVSAARVGQDGGVTPF